MRFSWESDILMSFFTGENLIFLTSVESSWESCEILMRKLSHENFVSAFSEMRPLDSTDKNSQSISHRHQDVLLNWKSTLQLKNSS